MKKQRKRILKPVATSEIDTPKAKMCHDALGKRAKALKDLKEKPKSYLISLAFIYVSGKFEAVPIEQYTAYRNMGYDIVSFV